MLTRRKTRGRWKPGESGNPSGRPKGSLTNADLTNCLADALCVYTRTSDRKEAITKAVVLGLKAGRLKVGEVLTYLVRCVPAEKGEGEDGEGAIKLSWPDATFKDALAKVWGTKPAQTADQGAKKG